MFHFLIPLLFPCEFFDVTQFFHQFFSRSRSFNGVCRSNCVPNFAISLFLTVTSGFPGSLIVEVVGLTFRICEPGASTSYNPSKFFFDRRFPWIFRARLSSTARSLRGMGQVAVVRRKRDSPSVLARSLAFPSCVARDIPTSTSVSLRYPFTHLSSGRISSGITVSSSKE